MGGAIASGFSNQGGSTVEGIFISESYGKICISLINSGEGTYCISWVGPTFENNLYFSSTGEIGSFININNRYSNLRVTDTSNYTLTTFVMKVQKNNEQFNCYIGNELAFTTNDKIYFKNNNDSGWTNAFSATAYVFE